MNLCVSPLLKMISGLMFLLLILLISCNPSRDEPAEWRKYPDPKTGYEVWQITDHDSLSEAFYFYAPSVTHDDRYLIFRSNRSGKMEIYRCDLTDGGIRQLTFGNANSACIHPDGESIVYIEDRKYYKMNAHTLKKEIVVDLAGKIEGSPVFRPTFTNDGRYTLVHTTKENGVRLYRVDFETKEIQLVLERDEGRISHALINPENPDLITYTPLPDQQNNMELPMSERPRARIINLKENKDVPFLMTPYGFRATHDSWASSGERYYFFEKTVPSWTPAAIGSIDKNGLDYTRHYVNDTIKLGHGTVSKDGKWFISDSQDPYTNPLILINLEDGTNKIICWPNASIKKELGNVHVHPNFSPSGQYIIYTSDAVKTGTHQVYVIPIKGIIDDW